MEYRMTTQEMINQVKNEKINTWFDLGLFIDKFKDNKPIPTAEYKSTYNEFKKQIGSSGIAFITFYYAIDGVTIELEKYSKIFRDILKNVNIHYIAGEFYPESNRLIHKDTKKFAIDEMKSFDEWKLYKDFFFTKLDRGSKEYNELIKKFWNEVIIISEKLGKYIETNNIGLLYIVNVCSNPGNVSTSLATVLVSEYLGIPVINNNHDFYWEGGNKEIDIIEKGLNQGPRDFFFTNSHLGEFFSQIEVLFPWQSRSWVSVNINREQSNHVILKNGHNPANVMEIGTAVDTSEYSTKSKQKKINALLQFEKIFSRHSNKPVSYSVKGVLDENLINTDKPRPIMIGYETKVFKNIIGENIIFLQPTRIVSRKRIEQGFELIRKLFNFDEFVNKFSLSEKLKLTILVTGPIPMGQAEYFESLVLSFSNLLNSLDEKWRDRVHLGFIFSEFDKKSFKVKFENPIGMPELFNIASLILLPSKTEGRGLPIIEATASGIPIFCSRYYPENVYSEVIGENLPEEDRLKVIEFDGENIEFEHIKKITERVFFPHLYIEEIEHNKRVVQKRYSLLSLKKNIENICYKLYLQLSNNAKSMDKTKYYFEKFAQKNNFKNDDLKFLLNTKNRQYMPGYGKLGFMHYLKSLIDPSFFRVEEQEIRGRAFDFAKSLINTGICYGNFSDDKIKDFYNAVENIFNYNEGEIKIRHDHSFSYRHRNKKHYPYHDYTFQELTGLINLLFQEIIKPNYKLDIDQNSHFFADWDLAINQLTSSSNILINNKDKLKEKINLNLPIAYFPGIYVKYELEFFAIRSVRKFLKLSNQDTITEEFIKEKHDKIAPIYVFAQKKSLARWSKSSSIKKYIEHGSDNDLKLLYKYKILKIIETEQLSVGIHLPQMGEKALKALREVKEKKGYIISTRRNSLLMADIVDIDRFYIGRISSDIASNMMGIPIDSGYIQFVPAGVRTTLAYPTPIQTAKDFANVLDSDLYRFLCDEYGEEKVLNTIKEDAETKGSPIKAVLNEMMHGKSTDSKISYSYVTGVYSDGLPWSGAMANVDISKFGNSLKFALISSKLNTKTVTEFINDFENKNNVSSKIAWNGGYILNPELVGKLALPESYIGSPLGLLISNNKLVSPPLFNKPALLIYADGKFDIKRVNSSKGIKIIENGKTFEFSRDSYNLKLNDTDDSIDLCYYDLMHSEEKIKGNGRVIVRLAGNTIKDIIKTKPNENIKIIPVGLTLSFKADKFPIEFDLIEKSLNIKIIGIDNILHAVEAGPMLVDAGKEKIDMEHEGWKTLNSIKTQAARLDFTDMRGPKIAVGIDYKGNLSVLTINGRIKESVGATHFDMAEIMLKFNMIKAMGFDPGGSSTLIVDKKILNISPYNSEYEKNIFSLDPQPRAVANAVIGYIE